MNVIFETLSDAAEASTAALVLAIIGMFCWIIPIVGLPISITGLVLSVKWGNHGLTIAMCIVGIVLALVNSGLGVMIALS